MVLRQQSQGELKSVVKSCTIPYFKTGPEHEASKKTANDVYDELENEMNISRYGLDANFKDIHLSKLDKNTICLLATHGGNGENGVLQEMLEQRGIAYTHSGPKACRVLSNKHLAKLTYLSLNIQTPSWYFNGQKYGLEPIPRPIIKKPISGGSKLGIKLVNSLPSKRNTKFIYELLIPGNIEISVSVLGSGKSAKPLPAIIRERKISSIGQLSFTKKTVNSKIVKVCRANAFKIHSHLNCRGITKTDFLVNKNDNWVIETDAIPGLWKDTSSSMAAFEIGLSYKDLLLKVLEDVEK